MLVDAALGFPGYGTGIGCEPDLLLPTRGGRNPPTLRMQRFPNRFSALDSLRALRSGQLRAAQVFVYLQQLGAQVLCLLNCDNLS